MFVILSKRTLAPPSHHSTAAYELRGSDFSVLIHFVDFKLHCITKGLFTQLFCIVYKPKPGCEF